MKKATILAELTNSTSVMMSTVKGNKNAIGYVSLGSLSSDVKAVKLDGVAPSTATVKDGSYKLQRPFKIAYINAKLTDIDKVFISFIMSKLLLLKRAIFQPKLKRITQVRVKRVQSQLQVQPRSLRL